MELIHAPVVKLFRNPWGALIDDQSVFEILTGAAQAVDRELSQLIMTGQAEEGCDSLGIVMLDPTRPRGLTDFADLVLATVEFGPLGRTWLPNGAGKADDHERHGVPNGELLNRRPHCLGTGSFLWPNSAEFEGAISGGSGQSPEHDRELAHRLMELFYPSLDGRLLHAIDQCQAKGQDWMTTDGKPHQVYVDALSSLKPLVQT